MTATTPGSTGTGPQTSLNPEAVQFCNQLISSPTLQNAFYTTLDTALNNQQFSDQIFDNFFNQQGFSGCTLEDVIAAQQQIAAYNLFYWQAIYQLSGSVPSDATQLTINLSSSNEVQVALGSTYIIDYTFQNLVLSWDTGTNSTSGQLVFSAQPGSNGSLVMNFSGVIDGGDISGTQETNVSSSALSSSSSSGGGVSSVVTSTLSSVGQLLAISVVVDKLKEGLSAAGSKALAWAKQAASSAKTTINDLTNEPPGELETLTEAAGAAENTPGVAATESVAAKPVEDAAVTDETPVETETVSANTPGEDVTTAVDETTETAATEAGETVANDAGTTATEDIGNVVEDVLEDGVELL